MSSFFKIRLSCQCGTPEMFEKALKAGQATAEYALLTLWTVIILISTFQLLRFAIVDFYYDVASLIVLPIP